MFNNVYAKIVEKDNKLFIEYFDYKSFCYKNQYIYIPLKKDDYYYSFKINDGVRLDIIEIGCDEITLESIYDK